MGKTYGIFTIFDISMLFIRYSSVLGGSHCATYIYTFFINKIGNASFLSDILAPMIINVSEMGYVLFIASEL